MFSTFSTVLFISESNSSLVIEILDGLSLRWSFLNQNPIFLGFKMTKSPRFP